MKALVIHGGAGNVDMTDPDDLQNLEDKRQALHEIVRQSWDMLANDTSTLDVVTKTIVLLENDPAFNAGYGSTIGVDKKESN